MYSHLCSICNMESHVTFCVYVRLRVSPKIIGESMIPKYFLTNNINERLKIIYFATVAVTIAVDIAATAANAVAIATTATIAVAIAAITVTIAATAAIAVIIAAWQPRSSSLPFNCDPHHNQNHPHHHPHHQPHHQPHH
jgi:hypothetical protein